MKIDPTSLRLPAVRMEGSRRRVDLRAVFALALPLVANASIQAILNLTDTWFVGQLSAASMAAVGAVHWLTIVAILLLGGAGLAVQTFVAQAFGAGDRPRAARAAWNGLWTVLGTTPVFVLLAFAGEFLLRPFNLPAAIEAEALEYWFPRMLGGSFALSLWALTGFFSGIGRTPVTLAVMGFSAVLNAVLNQVFIFEFGWGVAGAAWATTAALIAATIVAIVLLRGRALDREFSTRRAIAIDPRLMRSLVLVGVPIGIFPAIDVGALAMSQLMQSGVGAVDGAATQIVMMLTSIAYMPTMGFALAGTSLVGQSIGAGDKAWAERVGNTIIVLCVAYMAFVSIFLALAGPWLLPLFMTAEDPHAAQVVALGRTLLWFAAGYQIFDGLNLGAQFCLRGTGDMRVPTAMIIVLAWFGFVPLSHMLVFSEGRGWVDFLPQFGLGAVGGWAAALVYTAALGLGVWLRWRSGAWRKMRAL